jgi:hypothetical protein
MISCSTSCRMGCRTCTQHLERTSGSYIVFAYIQLWYSVCTGWGTGILSFARVAPAGHMTGSANWRIGEKEPHVIRDLHRRLLNIDWRSDLWSRDTAYRRALDRGGRNCAFGPRNSEGRPSHARKRSVALKRVASRLRIPRRVAGLEHSVERHSAISMHGKRA